jgi:hypothetical protein
MQFALAAVSLFQNDISIRETLFYITPRISVDLQFVAACVN